MGAVERLLHRKGKRMNTTRFSPPPEISHDVANYQGLMFAAVLSPAAIKLLLGCTDEEAKRFGAEAKERLVDLKRRIAIAKRR